MHKEALARSCPELSSPRLVPYYRLASHIYLLPTNRSQSQPARLRQGDGPTAQFCKAPDPAAGRQGHRQAGDHRPLSQHETLEQQANGGSTQGPPTMEVHTGEKSNAKKMQARCCICTGTGTTSPLRDTGPALQPPQLFMNCKGLQPQHRPPANTLGQRAQQFLQECC